MKDFKPFNFKIISQGGIELNSGYIIGEGKNVVAAQIDLKTKRGKIFGYGGDGESPVLLLTASEGSCHVKEDLKEKITEISFPDYGGYNCICAEISRYTLSLCLVKY